MDVLDFEDTLEPLGLALGGFLVLVALGTLAGAPWSMGLSTGALIAQMLGILVLAALGVAIVWLSYVDE